MKIQISANKVIVKIKMLMCIFTVLLLTTGCSYEAVNKGRGIGVINVNSINKGADVILSADYTVDSTINSQVYDFFDVAVRTHKGSPNSVPATFGRRPKVNTVRMLGGWASKNTEADTYKWDGSKYVYDFTQATKRIDKWLDKDWDIFQIVLDNPPWAFQNGLTLVDKPDGIHYLKKDANAVYGNSLPPNDSDAWARYIKAFMEHLVEHYGRDVVLSWRFRVGSEIDTRPQHWSATREEFFAHYQNTVKAVHAVLPNAKIGTHFREASFKGRYVDYTGNKEDSYARHFVSWAKAHDVHYDFIAISYYPHITKPHEMDMEYVYQHDIAPITTHPDWNEKANFEIHEFKFIIKMKRGGFESVQTSHSASFFAMFAKMMLTHNIRDVYQWGNATGGHYAPEALTQLALYSMLGNQIFDNQVSDIRPSNDDSNIIDGIFTKSTKGQDYDVLIYNFNRKDFTYRQPENVDVRLKINTPSKASFKYRIGSIDQSNIAHQKFYQEFPLSLVDESQGGWRKAGVHITASPMSLLNEQGVKVYLDNRHKYAKSQDLKWTEWQDHNIVVEPNGETWVILPTQLPSFAVQKIEVRFVESI
ncbi:hypothetical protein KO525_10030 [Psychrosphaera sp. B3R10]|uniref:GH39 family glycosyl hydrolase n=1 Tax=unclassified Psychrosphaera TaxID=2641570 RepID=UPI001C08A4AA|nr:MULTISPECIES: hypothetical protein [unclassified Psychrosphaera]MBU2883535.1 hypothetical protein [Psychrosphaera sp. I2R16]MBU2989714.1 hypothetical protein [Psychrosphaera sp. B3R10]MDO6719831.1 hypothetical protein [Psychrosphaera sp. 1_MG-2023]